MCAEGPWFEPRQGRGEERKQYSYTFTFAFMYCMYNTSSELGCCYFCLSQYTLIGQFIRYSHLVPGQPKFFREFYKVSGNDPQGGWSMLTL
jgi:hypothetical protein